jgi:hypothetical protein
MRAVELAASMQRRILSLDKPRIKKRILLVQKGLQALNAEGANVL